MSDHQVLEWLNENELRSFPLQETGDKRFLSTLSLNRCLLDALLLYTTTEPVSNIELIAFAVSGNQITVTVTGQADFVIVDKTAAYPMYIRNSEGSLLVFGQEMQSVIANVAFTGILFEPTCVVNLAGALRGVTGFTVGTGATQYTEQLELREGLQFGLRADGQTVKLSANKNKGKPITCQNYFQTIANDCGTIISYINGVTPPVNPGIFLLKAGPHVQIFDDPDNHRIYIGLDFNADDVCQPPLLPPAPLS